MSLNKTSTIFGFIVIVLISILIVMTFKVNNLRDDLQIRSIDLKRKNKQLELQQDSLRAVRTELAAKDSVWSKQVKEQFELLQAERSKVIHYKTKYETIKSTPVPRWDNAELDSLLGAITGYH